MAEVGADEYVFVDLTDDERKLLLGGARVWGGVARPSRQLAIAMGFANRTDITKKSLVFRAGLVNSLPFTRVEWTQLLVLTELGFASDVFGAGVEWVSVTGLSERLTLETLRTLQRKLLSVCVPLGDMDPYVQ